jgi:hypothetical protein
VKAVDCRKDDEGLHDVGEIKKIVLHAVGDSFSMIIKPRRIFCAVHRRNRVENPFFGFFFKNYISGSDVYPLLSRTPSDEKKVMR